MVIVSKVRARDSTPMNRSITPNTLQKEELVILQRFVYRTWPFFYGHEHRFLEIYLADPLILTEAAPQTPP